tara:strand:- start:716 stop:907 length:192 start_codon:yes stop_codon:yes gene_type:complete
MVDTNIMSSHHLELSQYPLDLTMMWKFLLLLEVVLEELNTVVEEVAVLLFMPQHNLHQVDHTQ